MWDKILILNYNFIFKDFNLQVPVSFPPKLRQSTKNFCVMMRRARPRKLFFLVEPWLAKMTKRIVFDILLTIPCPKYLLDLKMLELFNTIFLVIILKICVESMLWDCCQFRACLTRVQDEMFVDIMFSPSWKPFKRSDKDKSLNICKTISWLFLLLGLWP